MSDDYEKGIEDFSDALLKWWKSPENEKELTKIVKPFIEQAYEGGKRVGFVQGQKRMFKWLTEKTKELEKYKDECYKQFESKQGREVDLVRFDKTMGKLELIKEVEDRLKSLEGEKK